MKSDHSNEVFDPLKGYEEKLKNVWHMHRADVLSAIPKFEINRNAYYQGFITEWELNRLNEGMGHIDHDGLLTWNTSPWGMHPIPMPALLTRERMEMIKARHLLGIGDGKTLTID